MPVDAQQRVHGVRDELVHRGHFDRGDVRRVIPESASESAASGCSVHRVDSFTGSEFTGSECGQSTARARRSRDNRRSRRRVVHLVDVRNVSSFQDSTHAGYKFIRISKGFYNSRAIVYTESLSFVFFCFEDFGSFVSKAERGDTLNVAGPEKGGALPTGNAIPPCFS